MFFFFFKLIWSAQGKVTSHSFRMTDYKTFFIPPIISNDKDKQEIKGSADREAEQEQDERNHLGGQFHFPHHFVFSSLSFYFNIHNHLVFTFTFLITQFLLSLSSSLHSTFTSRITLFSLSLSHCLDFHFPNHFVSSSLSFHFQFPHY